MNKLNSIKAIMVSVAPTAKNLSTKTRNPNPTTITIAIDEVVIESPAML